MILSVVTLDPNNKLKFKKRAYKYQTLTGYRIYTGLKGYHVESDWYTLTEDGWLFIKKGYAWDGASGPPIDDETNYVPSLVHDVFYQMMRRNELPLSAKEYADDLLQTMMVERGASELRAKIYHDGVAFGGASSCVPGSDDKDAKEVL
jgi:hypothetical protein